MYAMIETGGKQYKVEEGTELYIEKLDAEEGETVTLTVSYSSIRTARFKSEPPLLKERTLPPKLNNTAKGKNSYL